jgi:ADP-heptose:LPS heptosyltransferase
MNKIPHTILISRTDSIGDVVLTLPVAAVLKQYFPQVTIGFMGKKYTRPVIEACKYVDQFVDVEDFMQNKPLLNGEPPQCIIHVLPAPMIAKRALQLGIPLRIGTTNRLYHWFTCNKMVKLSRRKSNLHEAQLNMALLKPLGIDASFSLQELAAFACLEKLQPLPGHLACLLKKNRYNLVLHPKSQGSAREWPLENFARLIEALDDRFNIFISGTAKEKDLMPGLFERAGHKITDITGKMSLTEFIAFINQCDGLVANSTGPLHIAAALGKDALGLYAPLRPIDPGRWAPLGPNAQYFVMDKNCVDCKDNKVPCHCITNIPVTWLQAALDKKARNKLKQS